LGGIGEIKEGVEPVDFMQQVKGLMVVHVLPAVFGFLLELQFNLSKRLGDCIAEAYVQPR
jgi:hypothetical protein